MNNKREINTYLLLILFSGLVGCTETTSAPNPAFNNYATVASSPDYYGALNMSSTTNNQNADNLYSPVYSEPLATYSNYPYYHSVHPYNQQPLPSFTPMPAAPSYQRPNYNNPPIQNPGVWSYYYYLNKH